MRLDERYSTKEYDIDVHKCIRCGFCTTICPVYDFSEWESESPRGRMQVIKRLNDGKLKLNSSVRDRMFECTLCGYCKFKCPARVRTVDAIKAARLQLVISGFTPEPLIALGRAVVERKNIFNNPSESRLDWIDDTGLQNL
ncbi:MAG: 4Fe-4S dicluster domain-containing protein, partial [Candidatus Bathyarchaeia archaeon]